MVNPFLAEDISSFIWDRIDPTEESSMFLMVPTDQLIYIVGE